MTAANPTTTTCPACQSTYVTALDTGNNFCAACRHEWDPTQPTIPEVVAAAKAWNDETEQFLAETADTGERFTTQVEVLHDDGGSGNNRADLFSWVTRKPHGGDEAIAEAIKHFETEVGSTVASARVVFRYPEVDEETAAQLDEQFVADLEQFTIATDAESAAYLESQVGMILELEGGQRAVLLGFPDEDHADVQLADGSTATVDFNDIVRAVAGPSGDAIVDVEIDDGTAEVFGMASLLLACMVIEAGVASIEGDGDDAHLIPTPTGWFPEDVDAIPLLEQAAAGAVAMLVQTFALPRDQLTAYVEKVRNDALTQTATEEQGNDADTSNDDSTDDAGDAD